MTEGLAAILVTPALGRREHESGVLDGARAHQHVPMRLPGLPGEGGRNGDERGASLRQRPVQQRKAQIVADCQAKPSPRQIGDDGALARLVTTRLTIALAACKVDVEHVNLVIAGDDLAARINDEGTIGGTFRRNLDRERTDMKMNAKLACKIAERRETRVALFGRGRSKHQV